MADLGVPAHPVAARHSRASWGPARTAGSSPDVRPVGGWFLRLVSLCAGPVHHPCIDIIAHCTGFVKLLSTEGFSGVGSLRQGAQALSFDRRRGVPLGEQSPRRQMALSREGG